MVVIDLRLRAARELWDGARTGAERAAELHGVSSAAPADELGPQIAALLRAG